MRYLYRSSIDSSALSSLSRERIVGLGSSFRLYFITKEPLSPDIFTISRIASCSVPLILLSSRINRFRREVMMLLALIMSGIGIDFTVADAPEICNNLRF